MQMSLQVVDMPIFLYTPQYRKLVVSLSSLSAINSSYNTPFSTTSIASARARLFQAFASARQPMLSPAGDAVKLLAELFFGRISPLSRRR